MNRTLLTLYVITDRTWLRDGSLADAVTAAIAGGATIIQLREKNTDTATYIARAQEIKAVCDRHGVPLIINDNLAVAQAVGAGLHLGASDGDLAAARAALGPHALIGATTKTIAEARAAEAAGVNYLGAGAVFGSSTKADAAPMTIAEFSALCASVSIPVVAIGGINADNALALKGAGMAGICVVSAVFSAPDIEQATRELRRIAKEVCQ